MNDKSIRINRNIQFLHAVNAPGVQKINRRDEFLTSIGETIFYPERDLVILNTLDKAVCNKLFQLLTENLFTDWKSFLGFGKTNETVVMYMVENAQFYFIIFVPIYNKRGVTFW